MRHPGFVIGYRALPEYTGPLYRWRDDKGREQITDKPPRNRPYETITYRTNTNVMPSQNKP